MGHEKKGRWFIQSLIILASLMIKLLKLSIDKLSAFFLHVPDSTERFHIVTFILLNHYTLHHLKACYTNFKQYLYICNLSPSPCLQRLALCDIKRYRAEKMYSRHTITHFHKILVNSPRGRIQKASESVQKCERIIIATKNQFLCY